MKQAFWIIYIKFGYFNHVAVIAETLEQAYDKLAKKEGIDPTEME